MALISAFIGRSFDEKDEPLWIEIRKFLDSPKNTLFSWEDAEQSQASSVSAKVKTKIEKNDIFIGILTKRDPICRKYFRLGKKYLFAESANCLTSYWVIQESGYALGRGKKLYL